MICQNSLRIDRVSKTTPAPRRRRLKEYKPETSPPEHHECWLTRLPTNLTLLYTLRQFLITGTPISAPKVHSITQPTPIYPVSYRRLTLKCKHISHSCYSNAIPHHKSLVVCPVRPADAHAVQKAPIDASNWTFGPPLACDQQPPTLEFNFHGSVPRESMSIIVQQDATMYNLLYFCKLLYVFRVVTPPIIRSTYNCNYSIWHWSNFGKCGVWSQLKMRGVDRSAATFRCRGR